MLKLNEKSFLIRLEEIRKQKSISEDTISIIPGYERYKIDVDRPDRGKRQPHGPRIKLMDGRTNIGCVSVFESPTKDYSCEELDKIMEKDSQKISKSTNELRELRKLCTGFAVYARPFYLRILYLFNEY